MENLTRRDIARLTASAGLSVLALPSAFAADFWTKTKPAEWTEAEIEQLRSKSPWAKKVTPESAGSGGGAAAGGGGGGGRGGGGGGGGGGGNGGGGGGGESGAPGGGGGGAPAPQPLMIIWESAKPIREVAKPTNKFPASLEAHYVIGVVGISPQVLQGIAMGGGGRRGPGAAAPEAPRPDPSVVLTNALKSGATLDVKGKDPVNAAVVMQIGGGTELLFAFPSSAIPLTVDEKEAQFQLKLGGITAKVKFSLKDMLYNGELAV